jgi:hypothetical protein
MTSTTIILRRHDRIAPNIGDDGQNAANRYRKASSRRDGKPLQRPTRPSAFIAVNRAPFRTTSPHASLARRSIDAPPAKTTPIAPPPPS